MADRSPPNSTPGSSNGDDVAPVLAGQRLAEARRANDISIAEIAKELHLDEPKVQALEENQFDVLGAPVFAKGHLRKYAELVGVPIDDVLADYYKLNKATGAPPVVGLKREQPREINLGPWIVGLVLVSVVGGLLYWWFTRAPAPEVTRTPGMLEPFTSDSEPYRDDNPAIIEREADMPADVDDVVDESMIVSEPQIESEPVTDDAGDTDDAGNTDDLSPVAENQVQLAMSFSGDCWTEVTDADGDRLYFGLGQAGLTVTRAGNPPLRALFGDHNNVSVTVDGVAFPLSSDDRRGNTARVTIDPN